MTPQNFSTRSLPAPHQFDAWRSFFEPVFDVVTNCQVGGGFAADISVWALGHFGMTRTVAPSVDVIRTKRHLRRDPVDHWLISYCARGAHSATTAGVSLEVPPRVPFLWSLGQEFAHERTHADRIQLVLARDGFREIAPLLDGALGSTLNAPLGQLLGDYMLALERHLPAVTEDDVPRLTRAVGAMIAAALAPSTEHVAVAKQQVDVGRMERVRRAVRKHLRSPLLGPKTLARLVGMSRSNLYRLLDDKGGVARYILHERLLAAHQALTDPTGTATIAAIAEDFCFADASSFGRAFKREFGSSPGDARAAARVGLALPRGPRSGPVQQGGDFSALLRGF
ncbi:MAG TPA: helix-turn-helix domain-containing protein [Stellaceae bacterium]|jgi:AraC-like DNA-binding protein|nr:helix-turn-helix domain-containing protein [Stellaceae bacterium]